MKIINDFNTTVKKALTEIDPNWESYDGLIVCGTHTPQKVESIIEEIRKAREAGFPFLGVCAGHQFAAIEYARNVLGIANATSEEFFDSSTWDFDMKGIPSFIVKKLPQINVGLHGGETYWNNYEVGEDILKLWKKASNFITCQFHPEYNSMKGKEHPVLVRFLKECKKYDKI